MYLPPQYSAREVVLGPSDYGVSLMGELIAQFETASQAHTFGRAVDSFLKACCRHPRVDETSLCEPLTSAIVAIRNWNANPPAAGNSGGETEATPPTPSTQAYTAAGGFTFTVPPLVTTVKIEAWGSGGAASGGTSFGGGGGGGYSRKNSLAVSPGDTIAVVVDAGNGHASSNASHGGTMLCLANSGLAGATAGVAGAGGSITAAVGDVLFAGGAGASTGSGGGGGSGGTASNGNPGVVQAGATAVAGGGAGGNGSLAGAGVAGSLPGGGGGGGGASGGAGAAGKVLITWPA